MFSILRKTEIDAYEAEYFDIPTVNFVCNFAHTVTFLMWDKVSWPDVKGDASLGSVTGLVRDIRQIADSQTRIFFGPVSAHQRVMFIFPSGVRNRFVSFKRCSV